MGRVILVGSTKGGVGKTSTALNIAIARALDGRDVWLIDGDRQATASTAIAIRNASGRKPQIACAHYEDGTALRDQVKLQRSKFDEIVIDAGGRDSTALRAALGIADVVLVPFQPRSFDVWAVADTDALITEAKNIRETPFKVYGFLNLADASGSDNEEAIAALNEYPSIEYLNTPLVRRKSVANAAGKGLSVLEFRPKDDKAIEEMTALLSAIF